jgi:predicted permease
MRSVLLIVRSFARAKSFAVAAVLTVALGIGVNAVVFSLFDRVLFRPLPYAEPDRLVQVYSRIGHAGTPELPVPVAQALAREKGLVTGIAWDLCCDPQPLIPTSGENPLLWLRAVTTDTLDVLGVRPIIGPGFAVVRATSTEHPVLLTYDTWQHRYDGSSDVLSLEWMARDTWQRTGSDVHWRVVGVLPDGFLLPSSNLTPYDGLYGVESDLDRTASFELHQSAPFARLAPGLSIAAAQAGLNAFVAARFPNPRTMPPYRGVTVAPLQSGMSISVRPYVWLAVAGAWGVLGVTCVTLAILLLTWSQSRRQESGVRLALGASPRRLVVNALVESALLCGVGAVIGWLAYIWARPLFVSVLPSGLQAFASETADVRVIVVTCMIALVSAIAAGTLPALRTSRVDPLVVLRSTHDPATLDRLVGGPMLLSVQAAFGVMLVVGALATIPGVLRTLLMPPGFEATDLFMGHVVTAANGDASDAREQTRRGRTVLDVARQLPGVVEVGLSRTDPLSSEDVDRLFSKRVAPRGFDGRVLAVDAGFFRTLATPMIAGRSFSDADVERQALVAIVNVAGARAFWPDLPVEDAVGRTVTTNDGPRTVIGVAADLRIQVDVQAEPTLFLPVSANETYRSDSTWAELHVLVRATSGRRPNGTLLSDRLRNQSWTIPNLTPTTLDSVATTLEPVREKPRVLAAIFGALGGITLLLATIAMYGLASFEIRRRRDEMTVRLALGATPQALRRRFAIVIVQPVLVGVLAGLPLSWIEVKLLSRSVPSVNAGDLQIYLAAAAAILAAALIAAWLPGRRFLTMRVAELLRT